MTVWNFALTSPHTPLVPTVRFAGKSWFGPYADFVAETDWAAGEVVDAIDEAGLADNTLVIFTSDNGFCAAVGAQTLEARGHFPSAQFRGYKSDIWDGGHRVPFIVRWPGKVKAGATSEQLVCLTDFMATVAQILGDTLPPTAAEDSVSLLPALLSQDKAPLREAVVHHSAQGMFAIRQGNWKLELCGGGGGWDQPKEAETLKTGVPPIQLYDMSTDIGEQRNVESANPTIVARLTKLLQKYVAEGRSTPGLQQQNDVRVEIFKTPQAKKAVDQTIGD